MASLSIDVDATPSDLYEILTTTQGMRATWTSDCDVDAGSARFGFPGAPVDLECTLQARPNESVRYVVERGFPYWNGSVFEWELGPAVRAPSGTNLLFRHRDFEDGYPEQDRAFTTQTWATILETIKAHAEGAEPGPALG
jgi:hypothetical protein